LVPFDAWCGEWAAGATPGDFLRYEMVDLETGEVILREICGPALEPDQTQEVRLWFSKKPSCNLSLRITHVICRPKEQNGQTGHTAVGG
jgi:hypothetical protein